MPPSQLRFLHDAPRLLAVLVLSAGSTVTLANSSAPAPAPAPADAWMVSGPCHVASDDAECVTSPRFGRGEQYANDQACNMSYNGNATRLVQVEFFKTERGYDILTIGGSDFSGDEACFMQGMRLNDDVITWSSDSTIPGDGWKICARATSNSWLVSGPCPVNSWSVWGDCQVAEDDDACVTSPNYPGGYEGNQVCSMSWQSNATRFLDMRFSDDVQLATCPLKLCIWNSSNVSLGIGDAEPGMRLPGMVTFGVVGACSPGNWKICARELPPIEVTKVGACSPGNWKICAREHPPKELPTWSAWVSLLFFVCCFVPMCSVACCEFSRPVPESHIAAEAPAKVTLYDGPYRAQDAAFGSFECKVPEGKPQGASIRCRSPFGHTMSVALPAEAQAGQWISAVDAVQRTARPADLTARQQSVIVAKELQSRVGGTSGAKFLHGAIGAEFWGVTMAAFLRFMASVRAKAAAGELTNKGRLPYPQEHFDSPNIGPNMYQVNEQVIKPMTASTSLELPGVSWALMSQAAGVLVTLFVTHAWAEGAYEFERKLLEAWPKGADGCHIQGAAYICFLSNPQNLDIGELLMEIETSPFNIALQRMPKPGRMLMIATENTPIHERLWCVFEAHLAIELEIPITLGGSQEELAVNRDAAASIVGQASAATQTIAKLQKRLKWQMHLFVSQCVLAVILVFMAMVRPQIKQHIHASSGFLFLVMMLCTIRRRQATRKQILALSEGAKEGQLMDVREAKCTSDDDARKIRAAIRGREEEINSMLGQIIVFGSAPLSDNIV